MTIHVRVPVGTARDEPLAHAEANAAAALHTPVLVDVNLDRWAPARLFDRGPTDLWTFTFREGYQTGNGVSR